MVRLVAIEQRIRSWMGHEWTGPLCGFQDVRVRGHSPLLYARSTSSVLLLGLDPSLRHGTDSEMWLKYAED
jgi:hypothetical protein